MYTPIVVVVPVLSVNMFKRQLKTHFCEMLTRFTQRISDLLRMQAERFN